MNIQKSYFNECGKLYLIPTPIGNLEDITIRALNILKEADVILCEDTRTTSLLLNKYNIKKKLISCHEYNEKKITEKVLSLLNCGKIICLVSDQGTPVISDPGYFISKFVIDNNYPVIALPGPTAFVPALISSGIDPSSFLFYGFLNSHKSKRIKELTSLLYYSQTLIFYESNHRIKDCLEDMLFVFGNRKIALCRELSKIHEEIIRDTISNIINISNDIKGEIVLIVEGCKKNHNFDNLSIIEHVDLYIADGMRKNDAFKLVSKERNISKSIVYKEYLEKDS